MDAGECMGKHVDVGENWWMQGQTGGCWGTQVDDLKAGGLRGKQVDEGEMGV